MGTGSPALAQKPQAVLLSFRLAFTSEIDSGIMIDNPIVTSRNASIAPKRPLPALCMLRRNRSPIHAICLLLILSGCASTPNAPSSRASDATAREATSHAHAMIGKPYRYGGDTPAGFDCSGLVNYSYARSGVALPRTTQLLRQVTTIISIRSLREGDLVFFNQEGKKASHVGLYLGDGRFIHAPSTGGKVRTDLLDADYWKKHFAEARRI